MFWGHGYRLNIKMMEQLENVNLNGRRVDISSKRRRIGTDEDCERRQMDWKWFDELD